MSNINIQIKQRNESNDGWNDLYPKTKAEVVVTNDGKTVEEHVNSADIHVTLSDKTKWNSKESTSGAQTKADAALSNAKSYTDSKISGLVNSAPEALDTLNELAQALNDNPNFAATVTTELGKKVNKTDIDSNTSLGISNAKIPSQKAVKTYVDNALAGTGKGDMLKSIYDKDGDGKVDYAKNSDTVNGHTVLKNVPANAVFTDTQRVVSSSVTSTSESTAATSKAVKLAYDKAKEKAKITISQTEPTTNDVGDIWYEIL